METGQVIEGVYHTLLDVPPFLGPCFLLVYYQLYQIRLTKGSIAKIVSEAPPPLDISAHVI